MVVDLPSLVLRLGSWVLLRSWAFGSGSCRWPWVFGVGVGIGLWYWYCLDIGLGLGIGSSLETTKGIPKTPPKV